jgi:hypothetical protein
VSLVRLLSEEDCYFEAVGGLRLSWAARRASRPARMGAQPEREVLRLHSVPHHAHQVLVQPVQVRLVAQPGGEGLQGPGGVVLPP